MNKEQLKIKLLATEVFEDNEYLDQYCGLIIQNELTEKERPKTQSHHILPKSYFNLKGLRVDNSKSNLVNLLYIDHILAHYYLCLCSKGKFAYRMQNGFFHLTNCKWEYENFEPEQDLKYYQQIYEEYILNRKQAKMSDDHKETLREIHSISVQNLETGVIYGSMIEAGKSCSGKGNVSIGNACKGTLENINKTSGGYHWIALENKQGYSQEERSYILSNLPPVRQGGVKPGHKMPEGTGAKISIKLKIGLTKKKQFKKCPPVKWVKLLESFLMIIFKK